MSSSNEQFLGWRNSPTTFGVDHYKIETFLGQIVTVSVHAGQSEFNWGGDKWSRHQDGS
jgi:hypothetical protein